MNALASVLLLAASSVPLPGTSSVSTPMQPPADCRQCHAEFEGSAYDRWAGSAMGHAARDPLFLAALDEAEKDVPGAGDFCLRCHAPEAWVMGRCFPTDGSRLLASDSGITCSACHRMDPSPWQRNGQFVLGEDLDYRGPYDDARAPHAWQQSDWISDSRLCGSCHDLRNPLVPRKDLDGIDMGMPFPEQLTYTEWATSVYAQPGPEARGCLDCHMPEDTGPVARDQADRPDRSDHVITGGNAFVPAAIAFLYPELGLADQLSRGEQRARAVLREAAMLEITVPGEVDRGQPVPLTVRVTNLTGHKLPTGYPEGRRMWLQVSAPALALDRGTYDPAAGTVADAARTWHAVQGQAGIGPSHRLVLNDTIYFDNRIPPKGFAVTATTAPVGQTFDEVAPGILAHWDDVTVTGTVGCEAEVEVEVDVTLWFQSVEPAYVAALLADGAGSPRAGDLQIAFEEANPGPIEMAALRTRIPIRADSTCAPPDAGVVDTGVRPDAGRVEVDAGRAEDAGANPDGGSPGDDEGGCRCARPRPGPSGSVAIVLVCLISVARRRFRRTGSAPRRAEVTFE